MVNLDSMLGVLILVLVEDGLGGEIHLPKLLHLRVLILVLVEDGLGGWFDDRVFTLNAVLILVLVEDDLGDLATQILYDDNFES